MDYIMSWLTVIAVLAGIIMIYLHYEKNSNEKQQKQNEIINELINAYKKYTYEEIKEELKAIADDYFELEKEAHRLYERDYHESPYKEDYFGIQDCSAEYQKKINFPLYAKHYALTYVLGNELFALDLKAIIKNSQETLDKMKKDKKQVKKKKKPVKK